MSKRTDRLDEMLKDQGFDGLVRVAADGLGELWELGDEVPQSYEDSARAVGRAASQLGEMDPIGFRAYQERLKALWRSSDKRSQASLRAMKGEVLMATALGAAKAYELAAQGFEGQLEAFTAIEKSHPHETEELTARKEKLRIRVKDLRAEAAGYRELATATNSQIESDRRIVRDETERLSTIIGDAALTERVVGPFSALENVVVQLHELQWTAERGNVSHEGMT